jgi:hypothetical protein
MELTCGNFFCVREFRGLEIWRFGGFGFALSRLVLHKSDQRKWVTVCAEKGKMGQKGEEG